MSLGLWSCRKDKIEPEVEAVFNTYLHLSHTRTGTNPKIDSIAERINYSKYDMLWLGGDLAYLTSKNEATIQYVDSIFGLSKLTTLWALGNHDYSNLNRIEDYTNRKPYYAYHQNGITFLVLDTQENASQVLGDQKVFVDQVLDTISCTTSHLVVLHHKLIWMYGDSYLEGESDVISNGPIGTCDYCINPNNFYADIYPKLVKIKAQNTDVICIGGDIGKKAKSFSYQTEAGISFLASGINAGDDGNVGLVFSHDITNKLLTWSFQSIESL